MGGWSGSSFRICARFVLRWKCARLVAKWHIQWRRRFSVGDHPYVPGWHVSGLHSDTVQTFFANRISSIGDFPYNFNTLYGFLNLTDGTAGETSGYTCDMPQATCRSEPETIMIAKVLYATAWTKPRRVGDNSARKPSICSKVLVQDSKQIRNLMVFTYKMITMLDELDQSATTSSLLLPEMWNLYHCEGVHKSFE